jgi:hypothetical protein
MDNLRNLDGKIIYIIATVGYFALFAAILYVGWDIRNSLKETLEILKTLK